MMVLVSSAEPDASTRQVIRSSYSPLEVKSYYLCPIRIVIFANTLHTLIVTTIMRENFFNLNHKITKSIEIMMINVLCI